MSQALTPDEMASLRPIKNGAVSRNKQIVNQQTDFEAQKMPALGFLIQCQN